MKPLYLLGAIGVLLAWGAVCAVAAVVISNSNQKAVEAQGQALQVQRILTRSCQDNGNPLRAAVAQMLQDQIDQSHATNLHQFFPQIPKDKLHMLIQQANHQRRKEIRSIRPVSCAALYRH